MITLVVNTDGEWRRLDQTENIRLALTKQFQDVEDPVAIICESSNTFRLPATPNNIQALGYSNILEFSNQVGLKAFDIRILDGNAVVSQGEGHLESVFRENGLDYFNLNVTSYSNRAMKTLQKMRFKANIPVGQEDEYIALDDGTFALTADYVKSCNQSQLMSVGSLIGFTPCWEGLPQRLDTSKYKGVDGVLRNFEDYVMPKTGKTIGQQFADHNYDFGTWFGDGLYNIAIREYRPYDLHPFFRISRLFKLLSDKLVSSTEDKWRLDTTALTNMTEFTAGIVLGNRMKVKKELEDSTEDEHVGYDITQESGQVRIDFSETILGGTQIDMSLSPGFGGTIPWKLDQTQNVYIDKRSIKDQNFYFPFHITKLDGSLIKSFMVTTPELYDSLSFKDDYELIDVRRILDNIYVSKSTWSPDYVTVRLLSDDFIDFSFVSNEDLDSILITFNQSYLDRFNFDFRFKAYPFKAGHDLHKHVDVSYSQILCELKPWRIRKTENVDPVYNCSYGKFWDGSFSPLQILTNWTKQFNIVWVMDEKSHSIRLVPKSKWITKEVQDISNRIDYSKDYSVKIYPADYKRIIFNYSKNETDQCQKDSETELINGSYSYVTPVEYTKEKKELFKDMKSPISLRLRYDTNEDLVDLLDKQLPDFQSLGQSSVEWLPYLQKGTDAIEGFGQFYLIGTKWYLMPSFDLYDDSTLEVQTRQFFPHKFMSDGSYHMPFNLVWPLIFRQTCPLYWSEEMDQLYGKDARLMTAWTMLYPQEYAEFDFSKYYKIGNSIWRCIKVGDYDPNTMFAKCQFSRLNTY